MKPKTGSKIYSEKTKINNGKISLEKYRMMEIMEKLTKTRKYIICVSVYDPTKQLSTTNGDDLHHYIISDNFPKELFDNCIEEYKKLI